MIAPFPYFGGKRDIATEVWARFGRPKQYLEPFCGSLAILLAAPEPASLEVVGDFNGFICLGPATRILRADMTWAEAISIRVGDRLFGFDEHNGPARTGLRAPSRYRRWRLTTVTAARSARRPAYRLTFDDGTTIITSSEHMWLTGPERPGSRGWQWKETQRLLVATHILKVAPVVHRDETWEAGWIGGLYDGEGHINSQTGWRVTLSQNEGATLDRARRWLLNHGFGFTEQKSKKCVALCMGGGMQESFRFLMTVRPERLIANALKKLPGSSLYGRDRHAVRLVAKEYLGLQDVVAIETDCHTFIAEGLASHNCNFWRSTIAQPVEVAKAADFPVLHIDLGARHGWLLAQRKRLAAGLADPNWPGDAKCAGWWLWGQCCWIGSGWCEWEKAASQIPHASDAGMGIQALGQIPHASNAGRGIQALGKIPHAGNAGMGPDPEMWTSGGRTALVWLRKIAARMERVRVVHGDWKRGLNNHYGGDDTAVFFDPPYEGFEGLYASRAQSRSVAQEVAAWCRDPENARLKIALCGHRGDYVLPGWSVFEWERKRLTYSGTDTKDNECVWFSPACLAPEKKPVQADLFRGAT